MSTCQIHTNHEWSYIRNSTRLHIVLFDVGRPDSSAGETVVSKTSYITSVTRIRITLILALCKLATIPSGGKDIHKIPSVSPMYDSLEDWHELILCTYQCSPRGGGRGGITPGNETILNNPGLIQYSRDTVLCPKSPGRAFKYRHNSFEIFSLKHLMSRPCAKVVLQIPDGSDSFEV